MKNQKSLTLSLALFVAFLTPSICAQASGFYMGADGGRLGLNCQDCGSAKTAGIFAGKKFAHNVDGEIGVRRQSSDGATSYQVDATVLPSYPLSKQATLFGKLGVRHSRISDSGFSQSGTSGVVGMGVDYQLDKNIFVRGQIDFSRNLFGIRGNDATGATVGAGYRF